jgi:hypothetical protein
MLGAALKPNGSAAPISTPSPTSPMRSGPTLLPYHFDDCLAQLRPTRFIRCQPLSNSVQPKRWRAFLEFEDHSKKGEQHYGNSPGK